MATITRDEWMAALVDAGVETPNDQDALTIPEFMALMQMPRHTAVRRLEALVQAGKAMRARKTSRDRAGRSYSLQAFRLVK